MGQFLVTPEDIRDKKFRLKGPEAYHVTRVLRAQEGQTIELFDGKGGRFKGKLRKIYPDGTVEGEITDQLRKPQADLPVTVNLYIGLLKPSHFEWALEKGTEIGISRFIPVVTPRTVVKLRELGPNKRKRWTKIVESAAKQSLRFELPKIDEPAHFRDAIISASKEGTTLVGWIKTAGRSTYAGLKEVLQEAKKNADPKKGLIINLFIGPEGGFSEEEIQLAETEGAHMISLGAHTLRSETAAAAAAAIVLYELSSTL